MINALELSLTTFEFSVLQSFRRWGLAFDILPEYELASVEIIKGIRDCIASSNPIDKEVSVIKESVTPTSVALT
jgi:hypothetical protein